MSPEKTPDDVRDQGPSAPSVIDPVCGMRVDPTSPAGSAVHKGKTYNFCSTHCLHQFQIDPQKYAGDRSAELSPAPTSGGAAYTCPMHPEVRENHPGTCPK